MANSTFKCITSMLSQLYTIHASKSNPLIYILTTDRTKELYSKILRFSKNKKPNLISSMLKVDFENAFNLTFKKKFHRMVIRGRFFHFTKCV